MSLKYTSESTTSLYSYYCASMDCIVYNSVKKAFTLQLSVIHHIILEKKINTLLDNKAVDEMSVDITGLDDPGISTIYGKVDGVMLVITCMNSLCEVYN